MARLSCNNPQHRLPARYLPQPGPRPSPARRSSRAVKRHSSFSQRHFHVSHRQQKALRDRAGQEGRL